MNAYAESTPEGWVLVVARDLRHPPATVWAALTEPEQLLAWAPFTAGRDLGATGEATLTMIDGVDGDRMDLAVTVTRAVISVPELVMNAFEPLITHSSPSRTARVVAPPASEPKPGSVRPNPASASPVTSFGSQRARCSSVPNR